MSQRARLDALDKFKSGFIQIMLATGKARILVGESCLTVI
jgi:superfamily II DNA/RNA helicase